MTQTQYDIIVNVLQKGVPALANDLIDALNKVITENNNFKKAENKSVEEKEE
jgi:hypothetical protein